MPLCEKSLAKTTSNDYIAGKIEIMMQYFYDPLNPTVPFPVPDSEEFEHADDFEEHAHAAFIGCLNVIAGFVLGGIFLALIMLMTGCTTTKYVTVPEIHHDTVRITKEQRDSIFLRDSI